MSHEALQQIDREVRAKNVSEAVLGPLSLFKYSATCSYENAWNQVNRRCRGIVFDRIRGRVVCRPFDKFFNPGEHPSVEPKLILRKAEEMSFYATKKLDGTMVAVWNYGDQWRASTPGAFSSDQAVFAEQALLPKYNLKALPPDLTYVCEMIAPWDRKVVDYGDREELILLAAFENRWDEVDIPHGRLLNLAERAGITVVNRYDVTPDTILSAHIPEGQEGYVLRFEDGFRVKIKSGWYFKIHKLLEFMSVPRILELLREGSTKTVRDSLPEYLHPSMDDILSRIRVVENQVKEEVNAWWSKIPSTEGRDFKPAALFIKQAPKNLQPLLFARMRDKETDQVLWDTVERIMLE